MCHILFNWKEMNDLERNPKKYISGRFKFLTDKGYKLKYFCKNGEKLFDFNKGNIHIFIFKEYEYIDCTFSNNNISETNIRSIVGDSFMKQFNVMTNIEKIDYMSSLVDTYLSLIEESKA